MATGPLIVGCARRGSVLLLTRLPLLLSAQFYSGHRSPHIPYKLLHLVWTHARADAHHLSPRKALPTAKDATMLFGPPFAVGDPVNFKN